MGGRAAGTLALVALAGVMGGTLQPALPWPAATAAPPPGVPTLPALGAAGAGGPTAGVAVAEAGTGPPPPQPGVPLQLGTNLDGFRKMRAMGLQPDLAAVWTGAWNERGWEVPRRALEEIRDAGATPLVHWYYWGDDISPAAVADGVWSPTHQVWKTVPTWRLLTLQLGQLLHQTLQGHEVLVVLESEFNKHGIEDDPSFDGLLAEQAALLRSVAPEARIVLGFGAWAQQKWKAFPQAAAASDLIGFQAMRAATRQSPRAYLAVADVVERAAERARRWFDKPSFLVDLALSSWGGTEEAQAAVLGAILDRAPTLHAAGLQGIAYRTWRDYLGGTPNRWFGEAERAWGLADNQGQPKPAGELWMAAMAARTPRDGATRGEP